jgi:hypothetical protein
MTGPQDPFATPGDDQPQDRPQDPSQPQAPPPYGQPQPGSVPADYPQPGYGQQYAQQPFGQPPHPQAQGTSALAIGALISAFLCSPLGIILGFVAKSQIKKTGQSGDGLATAAIIVGVVSMLLGIVLFASGMSDLETAP